MNTAIKQLEDVENPNDTTKGKTSPSMDQAGDTPNQQTVVVNVTVRTAGKFKRTAKCAFWLALMVVGVLGLGAYLMYTFTKV